MLGKSVDVLVVLTWKVGEIKIGNARRKGQTYEVPFGQDNIRLIATPFDKYDFLEVRISPQLLKGKPPYNNKDYLIVQEVVQVEPEGKAPSKDWDDKNGGRWLRYDSPLELRGGQNAVYDLTVTALKRGTIWLGFSPTAGNQTGGGGEDMPTQNSGLNKHPRKVEKKPITRKQFEQVLKQVSRPIPERGDDSSESKT